MKIRILTCIVLALVIRASSGVFGQSTAPYTITDLGTLGGTWTLPSDINALGQVVGTGETAADTGTYHAFLWQNGGMTDLGTLGGSWSQASAINDSGQIVGYAYTTANVYHAFIWQHGGMTDLGTPEGATNSSASAINDLGQVVGAGYTTDNAHHAFLWQNGAMTDLGTLGGPFSWASAINDFGQIVGTAYTTANRYRAFLWQDGVMTDLGTLEGATDSSASDINASGKVLAVAITTYDEEAFSQRAFLWQNGIVTSLETGSSFLREVSDINAVGQIVGTAISTHNVPYPFLWQNGVMTDLNTLLPPGSGWVLSDATAINDSGQIVGSGRFNNQARAYLLTPPVQQTVAFTVEPETFADGGQGCWQGPFYCGGGYYDETPGNWGDAQVRPGTDVDLWYDDGGIVIGGLDGLEWLAFPVNVPQSGQYAVTFRTASPADRPAGSGVVNVGIHGVDGSWIGNQTVPITGGSGEWHQYVTWQTPNTIYLPAGAQTLTMWAAGGWYNVRRITFSLVQPSP